MRSDTEREAREDARAREGGWSWLVVAIVFGIPTGLFLVARVYVRGSMLAAGGTFGDAVRFSVLGLLFAAAVASVWTWWERR